MWACPKCKWTFKNTMQEHSCLVTDIESHFIGKQENVKSTFEKLLDVLEEFDKVTINSVRNAILFTAKTHFLAVKPKSKWLDIEFVLNEKIDEFPIHKTVQASKFKWANFVRLASVEEIDKQMISWKKKRMKFQNNCQIKSNKMRIIFIAVFCFLVSLMSFSQQSDNLAQTPPMGWNSWNLFEGDVSEDLLKELADAMVETGMKDAGYEYIIIDDIWQGGRDNRNNIIPDPEKFPNGIKALADYIHSKGLKLGIYSTAAQLTCAGYTASYGFEEQDAKTFAEWGIDYLKYDYCNAPGDMQTALERYKTMGDALKSTGRPIVYAICEWGDRKPWLWGNEAGGHLWRTTWDSRDIWETEKYDSGHAGIMNILDKQVGLEAYAGSGGWNDPDLLMVGLYGKGKSSSWDGSKGCNDVEYKSHFSLWCILAAPLIVNLDVRSMNEATKEILLNKEMIAIDQDPLGKQGFKFKDEGDFEIWVKELSNEEIAVCYLNRSEEEVRKKIDVKSVIESFTYRSKSYKAIDVWNSKNLKKGKSPKKITIESHGVVVLKISKNLKSS